MINQYSIEERIREVDKTMERIDRAEKEVKQGQKALDRQFAASEPLFQKLREPADDLCVAIGNPPSYQEDFNEY